jgi:tetratricopeptide (TPR) repeat protein
VRIGGFTLRVDCIDLDKSPAAEMEQMFLEYLARPDQSQLEVLAQAWAEAAPKNPAAQCVLACYLLKGGDVQGASAAAEKASWLAPDHAQTLYVLALVDEQFGRLDSASSRLKRILQAQPENKEAMQALYRVEQKNHVYAKIQDLLPIKSKDAPQTPEPEAVLQAGPFLFRFQATKHTDLVLAAYPALAQVSRRFQQTLGYSPDQVEVHLIDSSRAQAEDPSRPAAQYQGRIRLFTDKVDSPDPNFLYVALAHEYAHLAIDRLSAGHCPAWLNEGLAQFLTQNPAPSDKRVLQEAIAKDALLPLAVLELDFSRLEDPKLVDLAYAQSFSLVDFLTQTQGWEKLRQVLKQFKSDLDYNTIFDTLDMDLHSLERRWRAWLK